MGSSNVCWGIDIGANMIKALRLEISGDRAEVSRAVMLPHAKVLSTPGLNPEEAMRVALGAFASQTDLSGAQVAVSVPGHAAFARFAKLPPVEPKKVPDIVKFEAVQQIPFPLEQVEWDYQTFQSPDSPEVEVGIFAITNERIKAQLDLLSDVGIQPSVVVPGPVAAYNALAYDLEFTERTPGTVILDVGTTSTDLIIADAGRVWMRTFPIGGHQFTDALVTAFSLSYPKAEKLKKDAPQSKHAKHIVAALRPILTDVVQKVQESIGFYHSMHRDANLTRLIGLGSTFKLPGLRKYLKQQLGLDVYRLEEFKRLDMADSVSDEVKGEAGLFATAYGLAVHGLGFQTIDANLVPVANIREGMWKRKVPWFAAAAGVAIAASGVMFYRPYFDSAAIGAIQPPREIQQAASEASKLKSQAQQAGVIGGATPDFTAANYIALGESDPVLHQVVADLGAIVSEADRRAGTIQLDAGDGFDGPALELIEVRTEYVAPNTKAEDAFPRGGESRRPPADDPFAAPPPDEPGIDKRRIAVMMSIETRHPKPEVLVEQAVRQWLASQGDRAKYPIVVSPDSLYRLRQIATASAAGDARERPEIASRPTTGRPGAAPGGGGRFNAPGGGRFGDPEDFPDPDPREMQSIENNPYVQVTGAPEVARPGSTPGRPGGAGSVNTAQLDALAPLDAGEDEAEGPASRFDLFWYVIIDEVNEEGDA